MPKPGNEAHNKPRGTGLHNGPIRYLIKPMSSIETSQTLIGSTSWFQKAPFGLSLSKPDIAVFIFRASRHRRLPSLLFINEEYLCRYPSLF